ncbi:MAG: hypothetical protein IT386_04055 [Deltaproteobacteria bacterium]|nr:hypothetical protein [Deltaproteobacteria bacterium]
MPNRPSVQLRLIQLLAVIAAVAVAGVVVIVPYRLYQRDIRHAEVSAHRVASVVHVALGQALHDGKDVADLVNRLQGIADLEIRLHKLAPDETHPAATSGRGSSELDGTDLDFTAPPILARDGSTWLATMHFDLSPMKRESVRLIIDLMIAVLLGSLVFSCAVFFLIRRLMIEPLREVTRRVERFADGQPIGERSEYDTEELEALADALERARTAHPGTA